MLTFKELLCATIVCALAIALPTQKASAQYRGAIAGAIVGGVAAAIIAGQIANAARQHQQYPPRIVVKKSRKPQKTTSERATTENKAPVDPFAGVTPTMTTRVNGQ